MTEKIMTPSDFESIGNLLDSICPNSFFRNAELKQLSRWRIGGNCKFLVEPKSVEELCLVIESLNSYKAPYIVIGDGSNLLFDSNGLDCVVIKIGKNFSNFRIEGQAVVSQAGIWVPRLARNIAMAGLTGIEHTIGIPGTLGGLVCMNGGSQRRGIGDNIVSVVAITVDGKLKRFTKNECMFDYRESIFQNNKSIVIEVHMEFPEGNYRTSRSEMRKIMKSRRERFPLKLPNCGSVFVSNPKMYEVIGPPGKAIEDCQLKGVRVGGAQFSPAHANFIVNVDNATSNDVLSLIQLARAKVFEKTGYKMETEVIFVKKDGQLIKPHTITKL